MKTLTLYFSMIPLSKTQRTVEAHIKSFTKIPGEVIFINLFPVRKIPSFVLKEKFDLIIFHYTFLSLNYSDPEILINYAKKVKDLKGLKIAFIEDDYVNSYNLCKFFKISRTKKVFTLFDEKEYKKVYPYRISGVKEIYTVLPGYVSENDIDYIRENKNLKFNQIDISYRSRKPFPWLGKHSFLKWKISEVFNNNKPEDLILDVSCNPEDQINGYKWLEFLYNSRTVLGVEGGASIHDPEGKLKKNYEKLINEGLKITHDEYHQKYLNKFEGTLDLKNFTPRIFEAIICKSCLVLVEGEYNGLLKKDINYIPIKKDFSNIEEVYDKIRNVELCKKIAEYNYKTVITSGDFTYEKFIDFILLKSNIQVNTNKFSLKFKNLISFEILINEIIVHLYYLLVKLKIISVMRTIKNFIS